MAFIRLYCKGANMTVDHIDAIYQFNEQAVTKILNGYYIELAREKETLYETKEQ